jgi:succinate dehydrogenase/fumarate reductase flavoprotein subunit
MVDNVMSTDVLVVGGGGAGFRAAIGAREKGAETILVSKGPLARSGASPMAGADLTADGQGMRSLGFFGEPRDTKAKFLSDIVHQGCFLNNQRLTEIYVNEAPDRLRELLDWGIRVNFTDERAIFTAGTGIMDALCQWADKLGVKSLANVAVLDLLLQDGLVIGALGLDIYTGQFILFQCKAVVLASGGWHKAYTPVTGSRELTGDGVAMAYRAGADLANMEFVTFCCNVSFWPPVWRGSIFPYVLSLVVGGTLFNSEREYFLDEYDADLIRVATTTEWNKSFISYATQKEVRAGRGSPHGGVYYDFGEMGWKAFAARVEHFYPGWRYKGIDFSEMATMLREGRGAEVGAAAEYFPGGVGVDVQYGTNVPGLYAAGECATSLFGANRVMAATTEMVVTGAVAGRAAGEWARSSSASGRAVHEANQEQVEALVDRATQPLKRAQGIQPAQLRKRLQVRAQEQMGPIRTEDEMLAFLGFLAEVKRDELPALYTTLKSRRYNKEWLEAMELENMVQVLEASTRAALARTESRGVHFREDHPNTDNDQWLKEVVVRRARREDTRREDTLGDMQIDIRSLAMTTLTPPEGVLPYEEMIKAMMDARSDVGGHH